MANQEHLDILKQGVEAWNRWREENPDIQPDISKANLRKADLYKINLSKANLYMADLGQAFFTEANFEGANLEEANLEYAILALTNFVAANLHKANLIGATLILANLESANLRGARFATANLESANLSRTDLRNAEIFWAILVRANLDYADLTSAYIYGISAWDLKLTGAIQSNLIITHDPPTITVDNIDVAQFIYLLLSNQKIRHVIDTITSKVVLILGRFTPERKIILDALRDELRKHNYSPIVFDFDKPTSRDLTETVSTLAHLARFIIVDLTDPSSAPHEVATVIPQTIVPVQPLMLDGQREYSMFRDLRQRYHWVLPTYTYTDQAHLLATLKEHVIVPAEQKAQELKKR
jgi:Uncharacterized low-complexity proteins